MFEILILAVGLSMDAFAVSIALGAKGAEDTKKIALKAGVLFGFFQAFMPLVGYLAGKGLDEYIASFDHWIAFFLLLAIGAKMIYESFEEELEESLSKISDKLLLTLAIATSIDAMAAGFSLTLFQIPVLVSLLMIGLTTFIFSYAGVFIGKKGGGFLENKAEFLGGIILIVIGAKILVEHLANG